MLIIPAMPHIVFFLIQIHFNIEGMTGSSLSITLRSGHAVKYVKEVLSTCLELLIQHHAPCEETRRLVTLR